MIEALYGYVIKKLNGKFWYAQGLCDLPPNTEITLEIKPPEGYYLVIFGSLQDSIENNVGGAKDEIDGEELFNIRSSVALENSFYPWVHFPLRIKRLTIYNDTDEVMALNLYMHGVLIREDKIEQFYELIGSGNYILNELREIKKILCEILDQFKNLKQKPFIR